MTATAPTLETFLPAAGSVGSPRRLTLSHPKHTGVAFVAQARTTDLVSRAPESYLSDRELVRAASFRFAPARENFLVGRLAAKSALGAYLAEPDWRRIELVRGVFGQPVVNHAGACGVEVSLSHSAGLAVAMAFPREHPVGVDLQRVDESSAATVRNELKLLPAERSWAQSGAVEETAALVLLWTVRESLGKALRCGLTCPLELLGAGEIRAAGEGVWESRYLSFSEFRCLSWVRAEFVLSIALPKATELLLS